MEQQELIRQQEQEGDTRLEGGAGDEKFCTRYGTFYPPDTPIAVCERIYDDVLHI